MDNSFLPDISQIFPGWTIVKLVGEGSFGKVYKCVKNELGIEISGALKVISIPQNKSELDTIRLEGMSEIAARSYFEEMVNDFTNEIKVMLTLKGAPNIVTVENFKIVEHQGEIGWDIYIFMEFLTTFTSYSANREMTEKEVKRFGIDICNGLEVCGRKSIIHRDIKPDNLFVDEYGNFKLGDFGVARRLEGTASSMSKKGTYSYMAPEVFFGKKYDNRADIYSLGMVMYKLLNRKREPFIDLQKDFVSYQDRTTAVERRRSGERLPPPVDASPEMASIILKACAFNPQERFENAAQFKEALESLGSIRTVWSAEMAESETTVLPRYNESPARPAPQPVRPTAQSARPAAQPVRPTAQPVRPAAQPVRPTAQPVRPAVQPARPTNQPARPPMPQPARPPVSAAPTENKSPKKKGKLIAIITAVLLLIAAVLALIFFVILPNSEKSPDRPEHNKDTETTTEAVNEEFDSPALDFTGYGNRNVAVGNRFVVAIKSDGTLITSGKNSNGQLNVDGWENIVAVAAGDDQTVALLNDGTVKATGYNDYGECNVDSWTDIVAIASGDDYHTVGLKSDGTVVATGLNEDGQCDTGSWTNIVAVEAGKHHTVALKSDGTVVATGDNAHGQCNVGSWTDIVSVSAAGDQTFGVKSDGTVVCTGFNDYGENEVYLWSDIIFIVTDYDQTIGVKSDGTMVFAGYNDCGESLVENWVNVNSVETDELCTAFIDGDGYLWVFGDNEYGQMDINGIGGMKIN